MVNILGKKSKTLKNMSSEYVDITKIIPLFLFPFYPLFLLIPLFC